MNCPDRTQQQAYLRGEVAEEVAGHIESCPPCQASLEYLTLQPDEFQRELQQAAREEPFSLEECSQSVHLDSSPVASPPPAQAKRAKRGRER